MFITIIRDSNIKHFFDFNFNFNYRYNFHYLPLHDFRMFNVLMFTWGKFPFALADKNSMGNFFLEPGNCIQLFSEPLRNLFSDSENRET